MANVIQTNIIHPLAAWFNYHFRVKKFNTPIGWVTIGILGLITGLLSFIDPALPLVPPLLLAGFFFVLLCFRFPEFGLLFTLIISSLLNLPERLFYSFLPWPALSEILTYLLVLTVIAKEYRERSNMGVFWKHPLTICFLVLHVYYILDLFGPVAHNTAGVTNFMRKQWSLFLFYFVTYFITNSYKRIVRLMYVCIGIAVAAALYGIKQQWIGLSDKEMNWLRAVPIRYELFFQGGFIRKFSFLNDPAAFGTFCASSAIFTLVLAIRASSKKKRNWMYAFTVIMVLATSYSGTRTCNLMLIAGIMAYSVFTITDKKTYSLLLTIVLFALFMLFGPFSGNPVVSRVKTTFEGTKDASASLRDYNRHRIQPYLYKNPMGGGIGTCGIEGAIYNTTHYLTDFQPDSGFMKVLVEQGWIGLLLQIIFYFIFLQRGIYGYFHSQNPEIKTWYVAITASLFSLLSGQYSQIAIGPTPHVLIYIASLAILYKLDKYDTPDFSQKQPKQPIA